MRPIWAGGCRRPRSRSVSALASPIDPAHIRAADGLARQWPAAGAPGTWAHARAFGSARRRMPCARGVRRTSRAVRERSHGHEPGRRGEQPEPLSRLSACAQAKQSGGLDTGAMQPAQPEHSHSSQQLRRRLRARARRVKILRRRIGALTLALFVAASGAILAEGSLGHASSATATKLASVHVVTRRAADTSAASRSVSSVSGSGSSGSAAAASLTTVTTRQS